jgi:methionyl-tRNA formyltransferase
MRVGFAGTPGFAADALAAIVAAGFEVALVLTQPDRPKGRGLKLDPSPVRRFAVEHHLPVLQPASLRMGDARAAVLAEPLDVLVVAAYGLLLPPAVLAWPRHGCINIHASLLPRWRGAAPIQRAIEAGDQITGVTIMQMDAGLDTGAIIAVAEVAITPSDTAGTLHDKLAVIGARAIVDALQLLARNHALPGSPQLETGMTYARKVERTDAAIDWAQSAANIDRRIRAFDPVPGAHTTLQGDLLKVWRAHPRTDLDDAAAGVVLVAGDDGIAVACGEGALQVLEVQPAAGKRMSAAAFARGHAITPGARFGAASRE